MRGATGAGEADEVEALLRWLWPGAPPGHAGGATLVVPGHGAARCLVSLTAPRAMQHMLTGYNGIRSPSRARVRTAAGMAMRVPLGRRLAGRALPVVETSDSFPAVLADLLGLPEGRLVIGIRDTSNHHAKPTIQVFDDAGRARAFVKIGWTEATAGLVRHETDVLRALADAGLGAGVSAPSVLGDGQWRGQPFVVLSPLPADIVSLPAAWDPGPTARLLAGPTTEVPLVASAYGRDLAGRLGSLTPSALASVARLGLDRLSERSRTEWRFGRSHGDFTRWNAGTHQGVVHLWDWEHAVDMAPRGYDEIHWYLTEAVQLRGDELVSCLATAEGIGAASGSREPDLLVLAYLVELSTRSCEVSAPSGAKPQPLLPGLLEAVRTSAQHAPASQPSRRPR